MPRSLALAVLFVCASFSCSADTYLILPFFNVSKAPNLDWVGESISESIREVLASEGIIALEREDRREAYKRLSIRPNSQLTKASVVILGESLDAEQVIYGFFEFMPPTEGAPKGRGTLRITSQILDLKKMSRGPEYMELGPLETWRSSRRCSPGKRCNSSCRNGRPRSRNSLPINHWCAWKRWR